MPGDLAASVMLQRCTRQPEESGPVENSKNDLSQKLKQFSSLHELQVELPSVTPANVSECNPDPGTWQLEFMNKKMRQIEHLQKSNKNHGFHRSPGTRNGTSETEMRSATGAKKNPKRPQAVRKFSTCLHPSSYAANKRFDTTFLCSQRYFELPWTLATTPVKTLLNFVNPGFLGLMVTNWHKTQYTKKNTWSWFKFHTLCCSKHWFTCHFWHQFSSQCQCCPT